jgi:hypothetical protein
VEQAEGLLLITLNKLWSLQYELLCFFVKGFALLLRHRIQILLRLHLQEANFALEHATLMLQLYFLSKSFLRDHIFFLPQPQT